MKVDFTPYEGFYNSWMTGKTFYPYPDEYPDRKEVILFVKAKKDIRTVFAHCESGAVIPMNIDQEFTWEVNNENILLEPNSKKAKNRQ